MSDLPEPMTPADCDLRGSEYMPLHGHKLFSSTLYSESTDAEFRAALRLWWSAWQQCPAGSLPSSDAALALAADYGRDLKGWQRVKRVALHGFVLCADGRLYHPILCDVALNSYALRLKNDAKRDGDRERLQRWRDALKKRRRYASETRVNAVAETVNETHVETPSVAVEEKVREEERTDLRSDAIASPMPDARSVLWSSGVEMLARMTGKPPKAVKGIVGKWAKDAKDDCAMLNAIMADCAEVRPGDPIAWISAGITARMKPPDKFAWLDNPAPTPPAHPFDLEATADDYGTFRSQ